MTEPGMGTPEMAASRTASLKLSNFNLPAEKNDVRKEEVL